MPADGVTPVILRLVSLLSLVADGKFTGAAVVHVIGANVPVNIIELQLEAALLARLRLGQW
jgi:hypothetical protein